jgi:hypothetical protein
VSTHLQLINIIIIIIIIISSSSSSSISIIIVTLHIDEPKAMASPTM